MKSEQIYIPLEGEGVDVWRPTQAERLGDGSYRVLPTPDYDAEDETWKFAPGSRVVCEPRQLSGRRIVAAVRLAPAPSGRQAV
jgi:hypothetical protein